ncbi:helix-turn-helix domain-containing protein [Iamia majanohamensis]|uniref:Helix-turn-helix domain-containing protein n=1 Tax=Iamia majanohamensis TaxID=467976 RepID=A0AAF0BSC6_9ACTN|nr:helix-turn-helix domain-containing protein [Iamia majanohamensis]WCO68076.1 helix-turn-helix domain-containing protein [Iamia majanohamensis]
MAGPGRDRLRELLDAVLDGTDEGEARTLDDIAAAAASSPFHMVRTLSATTGEPPVAMRRRVLLERAAWQLAGGATVTDAAIAAGYRSDDGFRRAFARAFGHPPSTPSGGHRLPAPNGIHFHPPTSLWVDTTEPAMDPVADHLVTHDLADTRHLIALAEALPDADFRAVRMPGRTLLSWHGPEESLAAVLENHVWTKEVWTAAIEGSDLPDRDEHASAAALRDRHDAVAARWLALVRDVDRRGGWDDQVIDALCDPPERFVVGQIIAHVITFAAFRRGVARMLLREAGHEVDDGDPIDWLRAREGEG